MCSSGPGVGNGFGNTLGAPFNIRELTAPALAVPDLEPVAQPGDHDVLVERRMPDERRGQGDAPLPVELALEAATEEVALECPALAAERVEPVGLCRHVRLPRGARPD